MRFRRREPIEQIHCLKEESGFINYSCIYWLGMMRREGEGDRAEDEETETSIEINRRGDNTAVVRSRSFPLKNQKRELMMWTKTGDVDQLDDC